MNTRVLYLFLCVAIGISINEASSWSADAKIPKDSANAAQLEHHHPQNWRFTLPKGDAVKGRAVFVKYECYDCHEVRGEDFGFSVGDYGPELSQMGPLHPLEFFAESIINPNAVTSKQYLGADGKSTMPADNQNMTVQELIDISAYLASLKPPTTARFVKGIGKIVAVAPKSKEVVIDHQAIKDFMDAMTMGYKVRSLSLLQGLRAGDRVEFTLDTDQRVITKIDKLKH